jgi:hypothetical protein
LNAYKMQQQMEQIRLSKSSTGHSWNVLVEIIIQLSTKGLSVERKRNHLSDLEAQIALLNTKFKIEQQDLIKKQRDEENQIEQSKISKNLNTSFFKLNTIMNNSPEVISNDQPHKYKPSIVKLAYSRFVSSQLPSVNSSNTVNSKAKIFIRFQHYHNLTMRTIKTKKI